MERNKRDALKSLRTDMENKIEDSAIRLSKELDEKIKSNSNDILSDIRGEYRKQTEDLLKTAKSSTLANSIYVIGIGSAFVAIIVLLSLIGYSKIKSTANDTVISAMKSQSNIEATKYVTKDFAGILIREKTEDTINELRLELNTRLEERAEKIFGKLEKNIELKGSRILSDLQGEYKKQIEAPSHTTNKGESVESLPVNSSEVAKDAVTK